MAVAKKYKQVTRKLSKELADVVLRSFKDAGGNPDHMTVFIVYTHKTEKRLLLTTWDALSNEEVYHQGLRGLLDTSGINRLVASTQSLQYKTNLAEYLYKVLKREEYLTKEAVR